MSDIKLPPLPTNVPHVTRRIQRTQVISAAEVVLEHFASEYARQCVLADRAARADAWQPIATAPKDGTLVMVYAPPQDDDWPESIRITFDAIDPESDGDYWVAHGEHYEHFCCVAKGGADCPIKGPLEKAPYTHWMPLPAAPTQERGADDEGG